MVLEDVPSLGNNHTYSMSGSYPGHLYSPIKSLHEAQFTNIRHDSNLFFQITSEYLHPKKTTTSIVSTCINCMLDDINLQGKTTKTHLNFQCGRWKTWKHPWPLTSDSWQTKSYNWYPSPVHLGNIPWGTILFSTCFDYPTGSVHLSQLSNHCNINGQLSKYLSKIKTQQHRTDVPSNLTGRRYYEVFFLCVLQLRSSLPFKHLPPACWAAIQPGLHSKGIGRTHTSDHSQASTSCWAKGSNLSISKQKGSLEDLKMIYHLFFFEK